MSKLSQLGIVGTILAGLSWAQAPAKIDFRRDVQPLFRANCVGCHGATQQMSGFRLDRRSSAMRGGTIPVIGPGNAAASRLYLRLVGSEYGMQMPPTGAMSAAQIEIIKNWIDQGAEWPDEVAGETPAPAPDSKATAMLEALRGGDQATFRKLLSGASKSVNGKGPGGSTPLFYAALYGDAASVKLLLDAGADPNIRNDAGASALMWAAGDLEKVRLLVEHGADVNATSDAGRTPLLIAAGRFGNAAVVKLLLDRGASPSAKSPSLFGEMTVLAEAAGTGDDSVVRMLVEHGADVKAAGYVALVIAIQSHCEKCVDLFLKNAGPEIVNPAMVLLAPPLGDGRAVPMMLDHGGDANAKDPGGNPILTLVASSDTVPVDAVKALLAHGADVNAKNAAGETALDLAQRRGRTALVDLLIHAGAKENAKIQSPAPKPAASVRAAVERSVPLLQKTDVAFLQKAGCVSCHNDTLPAMAIVGARKSGIRVDDQIAREQLKKVATFLDTWRERVLQGVGIPGDSDTVAPILVALADQGYTPDASTDAMAAFLKSRQIPNGMWPVLAHRPPLEISDIVTTATALRALQTYAPKAQRAEYAKTVDLAKAWLLKAEPQDTQERAYQLMAFAWAGVDRPTIGKAAAGLLAGQRPDGGWSQIASLSSDAYATGQALVALRDSGALALADPAYQHGIQFLLKNQLEDGSWFVKSRVALIQPYFESGFPYGHDQWVSSAATSWATLALAPAAQMAPAIEKAKPGN
jgi:ankyrin repeat protein